MLEDTIVIFLHMFKAGGTTVTNKIADNFSVEEYGVANTHPLNPRFPTRMDNPKLITGHFLFGIHKYLAKSCTYITFLRDPAERLASVYYNVREPRCNGHYLHDMCNKLSFLEFVNTSNLLARIQVDNYQVRELVSLASPDMADLWICGEDLYRAILNLQKYFSFIEFTENIDVVLSALKKKFGWTKGPPEDLKMNVTRNKPECIPDDIREEIKRRNPFDYQLIEWIKLHKDGINSTSLG